MKYLTNKYEMPTLCISNSGLSGKIKVCAFKKLYPKSSNNFIIVGYTQLIINI